MFDVGDNVLVKDNAFEGSDVPSDFEYRGKVGEITEVLEEGTLYGVYFNDAEPAYLKDSELEKVN